MPSVIVNYCCDDILAQWSSGQDVAFSARNPGFDSLLGYQFVDSQQIIIMAQWSSGQDVAFSARNPGFDSLLGYQSLPHVSAISIALFILLKNDYGYPINEKSIRHIIASSFFFTHRAQNTLQ